MIIVCQLCGFDGDCMIGMIVSTIAAIVVINDNYDDDHYHDNDHNDCFDDLRTILTSEGFLHLSISLLTAGRPQWTQVGPS